MPPSQANASISIWQLKPWWCQPWSILLTGVGLIAGTWLLSQRIWVTVLVAVPVVTWMVYFVWVYPQIMAQSGLMPTDAESDAPQS